MRMLIDAEFPLEPFNTYIRDGSISSRIMKIMEAIKPEAAYFTNRQGTRGCTFVVQISDASEIPALAEPLFLGLNARAHFHIAMVPADLAKANLDALGKLW